MKKTKAQKLRTVLNKSLHDLTEGKIGTDTAIAISRLADSQTRVAVAELRAARQEHRCDFFRKGR